MKLSKGIQFFAAPLPQIMTIYLSDNYSIGIGSDFDPVFTVGENFIEGNYSFDAPSSGTATDIDYTVSGNKITFTKNISGIGYTDFSTVNVAVGGTFSSGDTANHKFYVVPAATTQTTYDLTNLNLSAGNYAITVVAEAEGYTDSDASNSVNYSVQAQLAAPTIAMNADGKTLEITDVENATSYDVYVDGTLKTNVAYVKPVYTVTFMREQSGMVGNWQYTLTDGAVWVAISESATPIVVKNVSQIKFRTKPNIVGSSHETYMSWDNPTGRIEGTINEWVVSDTVIPTGDMSVIYYGQ